MLELEGQNLDRVWLEDSPYFKGYGWTRFHFMKLELEGKKKEKVKQKQEKKKVSKNVTSALVWGKGAAVYECADCKHAIYNETTVQARYVKHLCEEFPYYLI
jgi:hypothetical protein